MGGASNCKERMAADLTGKRKEFEWGAFQNHCACSGVSELASEFVLGPCEASSHTATRADGERGESLRLRKC